MNFLSPLFLLGALAVAGPIIFHLIRRTTGEVKPFSTLMFLQPVPPRVTSRSRLENLWLLLLRCLVLLALTIGFARPFFRESGAKLAEPGAQARRLAILLDTSASMKRENLWTQAREKAEALLRSAAPLDAVAVLAFDHAPRALVDMEQWRTTPSGNARRTRSNNSPPRTPGGAERTSARRSCRRWICLAARGGRCRRAGSS